MAKKPSTKQNGKISQVIGAVVDVEFDSDLMWDSPCAICVPV